MKALDDKLIVYDSNCKVCSSWRDIVLKLTSIPAAKITSFNNLPAEWNSKVDADKFRNVMALIDTKGGSTLYGAEGVAYIFSSQYRLLDWLFRLRPVFLLFNFLYKTQAYNRYIIATPKSKFKCDCLPDRVIKYRVSYIILAFIIAVVLTFLFGASLNNLVPGTTPSEAGFKMLLMAGTGWVLQIVLAAAFLKDKALDYIGHLGSIMVAGLVILLPWIILSALTGISNYVIPALSVVVSSSFMLYLHVHRINYLEMSQAWTVLWFLLLQLSAAGWVYFFYFR